MDLKNLADVGMADFARVAHFRGESLAKDCFGALDGDAPTQFLVHRLVHDTHASTGQLAHDPESFVEELPRLERRLVPGNREQGAEQETVHALFRLNVVPRLL